MPQDQDPQVSLEDFEEQRRQYYGLPKGMTEALKTQESGGRQYDKTGAVLTSPKQAKGRLQVLQGTADRYGLNADDPFENIEAGFRYLSDLHKQVDKNVTDPGERWAQTLAGYHAGDGRLRETNKTGNLPSTSDGLIRTDEYVANIMNRWQRHDQGQSGQAEQTRSTPQQPQKPRVSGSPGSADDPLTKPDPLGYDNQGRPRSRVLMESIHAFETFKRMGSKEPANELAEEIRREFGKEMEVGTGTGGWAYVKPKRGSGINYDVNKILSSPMPSPEEWSRQIRAEAEGKALQEDRARRRAEFERKPLLDQLGARAYDAFAAGGGDVSRMLRQGIQATKRIAPAVPIFAGSMLVPDSALEAWRQGEEARMRGIAESQAGRPSSFASEVGEGIIRAIPTAAAALGGGLLAGGGVGAAMAIGGGTGAAGADWNDPRRAITQTALNTVAPVVGGRLGGKVGEAVASKLSRPAAQGAARAGGELVGGAAGNVLGSGVEQLTFEGQLDPRELTKQAITGAALNIPSAAQAGRTSRPSVPMGTRPGVAPELNPQEVVDLNIRRAIDSYTQTVDAINRSQLPPATKAAQIEQARQVYLAERQEASGTPPIQRQPSEIQFQQWPRTPEGAIISPESPVGNRLLLPPAPSAPDTQPLPQPDAPITQESPAFRQWMGVENALTTDIPAPPAGLPRTTPRLLPAEPTGEGPLRRTTELPLIRQPETGPQMPQAQQSQRLSSGDQPLAETTRRTAEILTPQPGPPRRPTERLRVPVATEENVAQLRNQREGLDRLNFDREGELTRDLADERQELGAAIAKFDNEQAKMARGNRFDPDLPPDYSPAERPRPVTPEESAARRSALQPKPSGLLQTSTPGRPVTQEVQIPPARNPRTDFSSREDARQGHFEQFNDQELVSEIGRLTEEKNKGIRGKSNLSREELQANNFDLKIATEMQKERRRLQRMMKRDEADMIAPRTAGRKVQHSQFGEVVEAPDQKGVPSGQLRVLDGEGAMHVIKNPRTKGNRNAAFVKAEPRYEIPATAVPELKGRTAPKPITPRQGPKTGAIPAEAMPEMKRRGTVLGSGLGSLQPMLENIKLPSRAQISETAGGVQTVAQLGNPRFVIRNVLQHVTFGKQERVATRLAATLDWAYSKATGKGRQVASPRGSDLAAYARNWGKAIEAYKKGDPLPGKPNADYITADANKLDKAVGKLMTWMNEIPDAANWQTRFESSLQSIVEAGKKSKTSIDMDAAIDQATMEANRASLRDSNFASNAMLKIKQGLNSLSKPIFGTDKFGAGDFIAKYAQTPGALFKRGLERSPLGLFQVAKEAATPGPYRRRNTLLALSRVAEGAVTGVGLGAALAAGGVLVGPEGEGKSAQAMEREEGVKGYSLNASALRRLLTGDSTELRSGDTLYSIDWLQPWAMNLSAGAALYNLHKDGKLGAKEGAKVSGEAVYNSLAKTLDVMGDQSVLKNLSRYMGRAQGETFADKFLNFAKAVGLDVPSSFVPSLARQARQVADPLERDTRPESRTGVEGFAREAANRALAQLPGVSSRFPTRPSLLTGEDRKTALGEMGTGARVAAQFSPANVSSYLPSPVAREISRLNKLGEKVAVSFPAPATNKRTGEREPTSSLRGRERRFAERYSQMAVEIVQDPFYQDADDATKATALNSLKRYLMALEKDEVEEKATSEIIQAAMEAVEKRRAKEMN